MTQTRFIAGLTAIAALLVPGAPAPAGVSQITLHVEASNGGAKGEQNITLDMGVFDAVAGTYVWEGENIAILNNVAGGDGSLIANISHLAISVDEDPLVTLLFSVENGAADTDFVFQSALVSFTTLGSPLALATAAMTLTDGNGDGAWLTGNGPGGGAYLAQYNGTVPSGITFAEGLTSMSTGTATSTTSVMAFPGVGFTTIPTGVGSINSQFAFRLSAFDEASGTSNFVVVQAIPLPAPLLLGVAGLGCLGLGRLRRGLAR
jgi:hypothetical protein